MMVFSFIGAIYLRGCHIAKLFDLITACSSYGRRIMLVDDLKAG